MVLPDVDIGIGIGIGIGIDNSTRDMRYLIVLHVITDPFITTRTTCSWCHAHGLLLSY